ncbi:MAG: hypothetical protein KKI08_08510 [Armatimonadetes bacterium]|nr:hypothetical protein [Armatimonadota bacterium]
MIRLWSAGPQTRIAVAVILLCAVALPASAAVYRFDFGSDKSAVQADFTAVTPASKAPVGWAQAGKLDARDQAYTEFVETYRGKQPPPVWTTPLSQDQITSTEPAEFVAKVEPGVYHAWVLCGTSAAYRGQVFDFDVTSGEMTVPVLFENSYRFRDAFLKVDAAGGEARLKFTPRSRWIIAAVVLWQDTDEAQVRDGIIKPEREVVDNMPPAEFEKWKLNPRVLDNSPRPAFSDADQKRGYVVHARHWAEVVYPYTVPIAQQINPTLRTFATPGEYEPLTISVLPLKDFAGARVEVSDLKPATGAPIPSANIEIRRAKVVRARPNYTVLYEYRWVPDPLVPYDPSEPLKANENARFWLTVRVPADAKPGMYKGAVTITPNGSTPAKQSIVLRVLPIKLQEDPTKIYGIYYRDPLDDWNNAKDDVSKAFYLRKSEWEAEDLVAHGTRNVTTGLWAAPEKDGQFVFNFDLFQMKVDRWRKYGFKFPLVVGVNAGGIYRKYTNEDLGSHIGKAKPPPPEYAAELTRMCQAIEAERVKRGWPEFLYYPVDEPSASPDAIAFMIATLKAVQAAGVKTYVTADPSKEGFAPLRPYIDVWCTQPFLPGRDEILKDMAARKVDYWCYPNHVNGENDHTTVNGARMTYGFGFWRSGFTTLIPWIYRSDNGNPWNYLDGTSSDFFNRTEDNGRPIPVAMWEAYREGYDDYRYVYTLKQMIEAAKRQGGKAGRVADQAQKDLESVWLAIRVQPKYKWDDLWEPRETDVYRWIVAGAILKLQDAGMR